MLVLHAALAAILAIPGTAKKAPLPTTETSGFASDLSELTRVVRKDFESIAGPGTVSVNIDSEELITVRIAATSLKPEISNAIYQREWELCGLFPGLAFDFYFGGPELARVIQADLESISGPGTVDVSIENERLFSARIAVPSLNSEICARICDRELELYRLFQDLNFDFDLWLKPASTERSEP